MSGKKWFFTTIITTVLVLVVIAAVIIDLDPYFHFHGPVGNRTYALYGSGALEKYYNDGIGKHFSYDAMITGSSVTENFKASQLERLWNCTAVKTCFAGGTLCEVNQHVERSLEKNGGVSMVVRGIDENKLFEDKNALSDELPTYLYDNNPFNDVKYIYDKYMWFVILTRNIEFMIKDIEPTSFDRYSDWTVKAVFSKEKTLSNYERPEVAPRVAVTPQMWDNLNGNIEDNIVSVVREYPDVTFYYFLTPTSVCQWDSWKREGMLENQVLAEKMLVEELLKYDNVRIFGFSNNYDLITNLDNYMDVEHFSDAINDKILEWMYAGEYQLTQDNYVKYFDDIYTFYYNYDYESLFESLKAPE